MFFYDGQSNRPQIGTFVGKILTHREAVRLTIEHEHRSYVGLRKERFMKNQK